MGAIEILTFVVVFGAILAAYALGRQRGRSSQWPGYEQHQTGRGIAPVEVMLEYKSATGFTTWRKIVVVAYMPRSGGRSCLFALCNNGAAPRTFRVDRIVSIATLNGEILDTRQFLAEQLGVTA